MLLAYLDKHAVKGKAEELHVRVDGHKQEPDADRPVDGNVVGPGMVVCPEDADLDRDNENNACVHDLAHQVQAIVLVVRRAFAVAKEANHDQRAKQRMERPFQHLAPES